MAEGNTDGRRANTPRSGSRHRSRRRCERRRGRRAVAPPRWPRHTRRTGWHRNGSRSAHGSPRRIRRVDRAIADVADRMARTRNRVRSARRMASMDWVRGSHAAHRPCRLHHPRVRSRGPPDDRLSGRRFRAALPRRPHVDRRLRALPCRRRHVSARRSATDDARSVVLGACLRISRSRSRVRSPARRRHGLQQRPPCARVVGRPLRRCARRDRLLAGRAPAVVQRSTSPAHPLRAARSEWRRLPLPHRRTPRRGRCRCRPVLPMAVPDGVGLGESTPVLALSSAE